MSNEKEALQPIQGVGPGGQLEETGLSGRAIGIAPDRLKKFMADAERLDEMEAGLPIKGLYKRFEVGEVVRGVFVGFNSFLNRRNETVTAACWITPDKNLYTNGGVALVKQISEFGIGIGTKIQITRTGTGKNKAGDDVNEFEVRILTSLDDQTLEIVEQ